ncbi:MAG TPA: hypothetical protein PKY20_02370, partial [Methanothrix sp.]|nr:hypothetical protein [Methanothrix sp.]
QVKLTDTAEAVTRVISEKAAGQDSGGSVDLIWINGPNFLAMKDQGLLHDYQCRQIGQRLLHDSTQQELIYYSCSSKSSSPN